MHRITKLGACLGALALTASLAACSSTGAAAPEGTPGNPVRIGIVGAENYWNDFQAAAEAEGISVEIVDFAEYSQPNPALSAGDIDLNQFQHVLYLAQYNVSAGDDLVPIGSTAIYPLGLYSQKYASPEEIPAGSQIAIPNDESNQARALLVLQQAGLLTLKDGGTPYSTPDDIDAAASKVTVLPVDASLTGPSLPDVAASVINNNFVADSGFTQSDAIATDDENAPESQPYINIFATTADKAQDATLLKLVEIYQHDQTTLDGVVEVAGGSAKLVQTPVEDLLASLHETEDQYRAHQG